MDNRIRALRPLRAPWFDRVPKVARAAFQRLFYGFVGSEGCYRFKEFRVTHLRTRSPHPLLRRLLTSRDLGQQAGSNAANALARAHGEELRSLAVMANRTGMGTPLAGSALRQQWLRIRTSLFADAAWFRRSAADPIAGSAAGAQAASPLRPPTPEERRGLDLTLFSLGAMIERARRDLPNADTSEAHQQFVLDVQREMVLDSVRLGPKPPASGIDVLYQDAHRAAAETIRHLQMLVASGSGAPPSSREDWIRKAEDQLGRARVAAAQPPR